MASTAGSRTMLGSIILTSLVLQVSAFQIAAPASSFVASPPRSNVQKWGSTGTATQAWRKDTLCRATRVEITEGATESSSSSSSSSPLKEAVLKTMGSMRDEANEYADMFGLTTADAAFYALFGAIIKEAPLGPKGEPFVLRHDQVVKALQQESTWPGFFTIKDLEKAVNDDFLDAALGTTDNRKGWKVRTQYGLRLWILHANCRSVLRIALLRLNIFLSSIYRVKMYPFPEENPSKRLA
jgi:hypothetical protein